MKQILHGQRASTDGGSRVPPAVAEFINYKLTNSKEKRPSNEVHPSEISLGH